MRTRYLVAIVLGLALALVLKVIAAYGAELGPPAPRVGQASVAAGQHCADADFGWTEEDADSARILQWADLHAAKDGYWVKSVSYKFVAIRADGGNTTYRGTSPGNSEGAWSKFVNPKVGHGEIFLTYELPTIKLTDGATVIRCAQSKIRLHLQR